MSKCGTCQYATFGGWDPTSDVCDGCRNNADTGWGGFTDGMTGKHWNSEEERSANTGIPGMGFDAEEYDRDEMD